MCGGKKRKDTHAGKKSNQRIETALAAAKEISVGAAAATMTVLAELKKGTNGIS